MPLGSSEAQVNLTTLPCKGHVRATFLEGSETSSTASSWRFALPSWAAKSTRSSMYGKKFNENIRSMTFCFILPSH